MTSLPATVSVCKRIHVEVILTTVMFLYYLHLNKNIPNDVFLISLPINSVLEKPTMMKIVNVLILQQDRES